MIPDQCNRRDSRPASDDLLKTRQERDQAQESLHVCSHLHFTFIQFTDTFIQRDLEYFQVIHFLYQYVCYDLCAPKQCSTNLTTETPVL